MIDLHTHILPAVDDGPDALEGSLALAGAAADSGTRVIAATPHLRADHPLVRVEEIAERCRELDAAVQAAGIPLHVIPGAEVDLLWAFAASPEQLRLATFGQRGTDLLLETPYGALPPNFADLVMRLVDQGLRVLLAHPERNPTIQRDPRPVTDLVARGVLVQLTGASLGAPARGSRSQGVATWLLEHGAAHVVASDAHTAGPWRSPDLRQAARRLESVDPARARWMLEEVPPAIVAGEPLPAAPAPVSAARGPLRRLRRARATSRRLSASPS